MKKIVQKMIESNFTDESSTSSELFFPKRPKSETEKNLNIDNVIVSTDSSDKQKVNTLQTNMPWFPAGHEKPKSPRKPHKQLNIKTFSEEILPDQQDVKEVRSRNSSKEDVSSPAEIIPTKTDYFKRNPNFTLTNNEFSVNHDSLAQESSKSDSNEINHFDVTDNSVQEKQVEVSSKTASYHNWKDDKTMSEKMFEQKSQGNGDYLVQFAKNERHNQLSWINNEINHLCRLKSLLEKPKSKLTLSNSSLQKKHIEDMKGIKKTTTVYMVSEKSNMTPQTPRKNRRNYVIQTELSTDSSEPTEFHLHGRKYTVEELYQKAPKENRDKIGAIEVLTDNATTNIKVSVCCKKCNNKPCTCKTKCDLCRKYPCLCFGRKIISKISCPRCKRDTCLCVTETSTKIICKKCFSKPCNCVSDELANSSKLYETSNSSKENYTSKSDNANKGESNSFDSYNGASENTSGRDISEEYRQKFICHCCNNFPCKCNKYQFKNKETLFTEGSKSTTYPKNRDNLKKESMRTFSKKSTDNLGDRKCRCHIAGGECEALKEYQTKHETVRKFVDEGMTTKKISTQDFEIQTNKNASFSKPKLVEEGVNPNKISIEDIESQTEGHSQKNILEGYQSKHETEKDIDNGMPQHILTEVIKNQTEQHTNKNIPKDQPEEIKQKTVNDGTSTTRISSKNAKNQTKDNDQSKPAKLVDEGLNTKRVSTEDTDNQTDENPRKIKDIESFQEQTQTISEQPKPSKDKMLQTFLELTHKDIQTLEPDKKRTRDHNVGDNVSLSETQTQTNSIPIKRSMITQTSTKSSSNSSTKSSKKLVCTCCESCRKNTIYQNNEDKQIKSILGKPADEKNAEAGVQTEQYIKHKRTKDKKNGRNETESKQDLSIPGNRDYFSITNFLNECAGKSSDEATSSSKITHIGHDSITSELDSDMLVDETSESLVTCLCCKKKFSSECLNTPSQKTEDSSYKFCKPCLKNYSITSESITDPKHACTCYSSSQGEDSLKHLRVAADHLKKVEEYCTCTVPLQSKSIKYCSHCKCKLKRTVRNKNGIAYTLTLEHEIPTNNSPPEVKKRKSMEEIKIKVPLLYNGKKHKDKENISRKDSEHHNGKYICVCDECSKMYKRNKVSRFTLQEYLCQNRPDFIDSAEYRRRTVLTSKQVREENQDHAKLKFLEENLANNKYNKIKLFSAKEMKDITKKNYQKLPEVQEKLQNRKEKQLKDANKLISDVFARKIRRSVLKGKRNFPTDSNVLNLM